VTHRVRRTVAAITALVLLTTACSGGDEPDDGTDGQVAADDATDAGADDGTDDEPGGSDPEPLDDGDDGDDAGEADDGGEDADEPDTADDGATSAPPLGTEASTEDRQQEPEGTPGLWLSDVRVGTHDGFDRVVFEVDGEGTTGWFTTSDDQAFEQGSGEPIELQGSAVIDVGLRGITIPPERPADAESFEEDRVPAPAGARVLTEVAVGTIFEGQQQLVIGLTEPVAYRIALLDEPQRVVIDLVHP
jgi:hypothetical protein